MDNVTHSLIAVLLARAGLRRLTPAATPILLIASNAPDADVLAQLAGPLEYLDSHRQLSHSLIAGPAIGIVAAILFSRTKDWRFVPAAVAGTIGAWSHSLLDLLNPYGIRSLLPWNSQWFHLDLFLFIDPWLTAILLLCVVAPILSSLVSGEIGAKKASGSGWAIAGLTFALLWGGARFQLHERALETLRSRQFLGAVPVRAAAWPSAWSPLLWSGYVSTEAFWGLYTIDLSREFDPERGRIYYKPEGAALLNAARRTPEAIRFLEVAQFPVWRVLPTSEPENGSIVEATDARFGLPENGQFQLTVILDSNRTPVSAKFVWGNPFQGIGLLRD
jgi:membrane-bound metal-dependent hydrolase YbcI (DUF457 family)